MAIVDITNGYFHSLGLPRVITHLLLEELGWQRPLDMLLFLRYVHNHTVKQRADNVRTIELKLMRTYGFGPKRIRKVIEALIAHDIL